MKDHSRLIGGQLAPDTMEWELAARVLYTWADPFVADVRSMPLTRFIHHRIPTFPNVIPKAVKLVRYAPEEEQWQQIHIPKLEEEGVITKCM